MFSWALWHMGKSSLSGAPYARKARNAHKCLNVWMQKFGLILNAAAFGPHSYLWSACVCWFCIITVWLLWSCKVNMLHCSVMLQSLQWAVIEKVLIFLQHYKSSTSGRMRTPLLSFYKQDLSPSAEAGDQEAHLLDAQVTSTGSFQHPPTHRQLTLLDGFMHPCDPQRFVVWGNIPGRVSMANCSRGSNSVTPYETEFWRLDNISQKWENGALLEGKLEGKCLVVRLDTEGPLWALPKKNNMG